MDTNGDGVIEYHDESFVIRTIRKIDKTAEKELSMREPTSPSVGRLLFSPKNFSTPFLTSHNIRIQVDSPLTDGPSCSVNSNKFRLSVNPFSPTGIKILKNKQRTKQVFERSDFHSPDYRSQSSVDLFIRNLMDKGEITNVGINDLMTSRFNEEFKMDCYIATGTFGEVYKCTNLFDGISYAIKRTKETINKSQVYMIRKEVYAHSVIGRHSNIVSYFTAWHERHHIYIQTEFCNGGTLEDKIHKSDHVFCDSALKRLLCHVCNGLAHIHSKRLAHLDIKTANILISHTNSSSLFAEDLYDGKTIDKDIVYKIGDFGHTICIDDIKAVEDGDCRYLPKELLRDDYSQLQKADMFSTALTIYEAATKKYLPKNGPEWHRLRDGQFSLPLTIDFSVGLENILRKMADLNPINRPSASIVVNILLSKEMEAVKQQNKMQVWKSSPKSFKLSYPVGIQTPLRAFNGASRYENSKFYRSFRKENMKRLVVRKTCRSYCIPRKL